MLLFQLTEEKKNLTSSLESTQADADYVKAELDKTKSKSAIVSEQLSCTLLYKCYI